MLHYFDRYSLTSKSSAYYIGLFCFGVIMDVVSLALFKFKNLEGVLEDWYAHEATSSLYKKGNRKVLVDFDIKNDTATIVDSQNPFSEKTLPISKLMAELKFMNIVKERQINRNLCSYTQKEI